MKLSGRNIIITGAACGIGKLMAQHFADEKANIALLDINKAAVDDLALELKKLGIKACSYYCDIADRKQVAEVARQIRQDFKTIDVVVNNAGIVIGKKFMDLSLEEMDKTMQVNFWGHVYFTKEFLPEMYARNSGMIVNVASSAGLLGMPMISDYAASKFAELGQAEALRRELKKDGKKGVKIVCVCPYTIDTGMFEGYKPIAFNPILKADYVARKIVQAVKKDKPYVMLPAGSIFLMRFMKLFSTSFLDWSLQATGGASAMDAYTGRQQSHKGGV